MQRVERKMCLVSAMPFCGTGWPPEQHGVPQNGCSSGVLTFTKYVYLVVSALPLSGTSWPHEQPGIPHNGCVLCVLTGERYVYMFCLQGCFVEQTGPMAAKSNGSSKTDAGGYDDGEQQAAQQEHQQKQQLEHAPWCLR